MNFEVFGSREKGEEEEGPHMMLEEAQPSIPEEHSTSNIAPSGAWIGAARGGGKGESNKVSTVVCKENKEEDQPTDKLVDHRLCKSVRRRFK